MNILITGANMINNGAQALLFVAVDQLKTIFPGCTIFYGTARGESVENYTFERLYIEPFVKKTFLSGNFEWPNRLKLEVKNIIKKISHKTDGFNSVNQSLRLLNEIDLIIDVSGYALSDKWGYDYNESYLDNIRIAKKLNIPICLMPQSFGPFKYGNLSPEKAKKLKEDIRDLLKYPAVVFAREEESANCLRELGISNYKLSRDLVLQAHDINYSNIFKIVPDAYKDTNIKTVSARKVGVIPNQQIKKRGYQDSLLQEYEKVFDYLYKNGYTIYAISHSGEDLSICKEIAERFSGYNFIVPEKEMNSYEYTNFIADFDFVISSRFHAAVHALKKGVPVITVGWAPKYKELMESVKQGKYAFDITENYKSGDLAMAVSNLTKELDESKKLIRTNMIEIQKENCFDEVAKVIIR